MSGEGDKVIALLPWDNTVRRARTRKSAHELLERKDADQAIRSMSEIETYYAVKELGLESSLPILAVLEPPQICALIDLDVWHDDRAGIADLALWLSAFREASVEQLARAVASIDPELMALLLHRRLHVALAPREDDPAHEIPEWVRYPPEEIQPLVKTTDQRFVIAARVVDPEDDRPIDEEERKQVLELVDILYKEHDFELIAGLLRMAESDFASDLEESAYRFRSGRLEDLGFPERSRALEIFAPLDPDAALEGRETIELGPEFSLPALHAGRFANGLFQEVLRSIESPEVIRRVEGELVALANAALVAERVEPGDLERLREVLDRTRSTIELALAHRLPAASLAGAGRERLIAHDLRTLFRIGWSLVLELGSRARRIAESGVFRIGGERLALLAERDRAVLEALLERRPRLARVLEDGAADPDDRRAFASSSDLELAREALADLESLERAVVALDLSVANLRLAGNLEPPVPAERSADMLIATAAANVLLGRSFTVEPLDRRALEELVRRVASFDPEAVVRAAAEAVRAPSALPGVEKRVRESIRALEEGLSPLVSASEIDPRFVGIVVRRLS